MARVTPKQFAIEMDQIARLLVPKIGKQVHSKVTEAVYKGIVQKTPVLTGRARGNWHPTLGAPSEAVGEEVFGGSVTGEPMTGKEKGRVRAVTSKLEALPLGTSKSFVTNNLDYIQRLEDGSSPKSPPAAMVQSAIINTLDALQINIRSSGKVD